MVNPEQTEDEGKAGKHLKEQAVQSKYINIAFKEAGHPRHSVYGILLFMGCNCRASGATLLNQISLALERSA